MIDYISIVLGIIVTTFIFSRVLKSDNYVNSQHMDYLTQYNPDK